MAQEKIAVFIICSPVKTSLYHFANLIFDTAIKVLVSYAQAFPDGRLPRDVRMLFDDFGCTAPKHSYHVYNSIF